MPNLIVLEYRVKEIPNADRANNVATANALSAAIRKDVSPSSTALYVNIAVIVVYMAVVNALENA